MVSDMFTWFLRHLGKLALLQNVEITCRKLQFYNNKVAVLQITLFEDKEHWETPKKLKNITGCKTYRRVL